MQWWNFSNIPFVLFFVIMLLFIITFLVMISSFFYLSHLKKIYRKKIHGESNSIRVYNIDLKNNRVTYFNKNNIRRKQSCDLAKFYDSFVSSDVEKVKSWIFAISVDTKNTDDFLEVDVKVDRGRKKYFSILKLNKHNPNTGIIHVESVILKYITPNNSSYTYKKGQNTGVIKRLDMAEIIKDQNHFGGFSFGIRFYYIQQETLTNDKSERYMAIALKNTIYPFCTDKKNPRQIVDMGPNEILLFDLKMDNKDDALQLANSISHSLKKCMGVNGFTNAINYVIAIVDNKELSPDLDLIIDKIEECCVNGQQNGVTINYYQPSENEKKEIGRYKNDVDHLMEEKTLRYLYRPIVDASFKSISGYFQYVKAYDSPFHSYQEMAKYASLVGKSRDLFANIARHVISQFASEIPNPDYRLYLNISMYDLSYASDILKQMPSINNINLVLLFDEVEINEFGYDVLSLGNSLKILKDNEFEIALSLKDKGLLLDPSVYTYFNFFVASSSMVGEIKQNNRSRISIHSLIEQLLKYKKPIIANDLENWAAIELIIKSGIFILSSEAISPSNDMVLPIEKRKMDKISNLYDKYR